MQKLVQWLGNKLAMLLSVLGAVEPQGPAPTGLGLNAARSSARITTIGLLYTTVIGLIDLAATKGMSFDFFYLLGCAFVGWAGGSRPATVVTLVAGVFTYLDGTHVQVATMPSWVV